MQIARYNASSELKISLQRRTNPSSRVGKNSSSTCAIRAACVTRGPFERAARVRTMERLVLSLVIRGEIVYCFHPEPIFPHKPIIALESLWAWRLYLLCFGRIVLLDREREGATASQLSSNLHPLNLSNNLKIVARTKSSIPRNGRIYPQRIGYESIEDGRVITRKESKIRSSSHRSIEGTSESAKRES